MPELRSIEEPGQAAMFADPRGKAFPAEITQHEPKFQRAESSPELDPVVHPVFHFGRVAGFQVLRNEGEGFFQLLQIAAVQH